MNDPASKLQDKILRFLADKMDDFYLAGGTALSRYYFQHRSSEDLDFFTQKYSRLRIQEITNCLAKGFNKKLSLIAEQIEKKGLVKIAVYYMPQGKTGVKIDFVEDYLRLIEPCKKINGIWVISLPDIYLRKIYTLIGNMTTSDPIGRIISTGRQEAKDFFDLYFLSHTFSKLSNFAWKYCSPTEREALIHWYRTYDRMNIKSSLLDLNIRQKNNFDFSKIDKHFKKEIDLLLEKEIGKL